jgi:hypothetical protein
MSTLTVESISSSSDDKLFKLLSKELEGRTPAARNSPEFLPQIRGPPLGLREMAATYELDGSPTMEDLGRHFGNRHARELEEETAGGLEVLGAPELAGLFGETFRLPLPRARDIGRRRHAHGRTHRERIPIELDRFCDARISIQAEMTAVENGSADTKCNLLKNAPHTADMIASDNWNKP